MKQALEDHHHHYISDTVRSNELNAIEINCEKNYIDRDFYLIHIKQKKKVSHYWTF